MKNIYNEKILKKLEDYLAEYDKIFLMLEDVLDEMKETFYNVENIKNKKILLLTLQNININRNSFVVCRQITETEMDYIIKLYFMYEFSDRVQVISKKNIYGGLFFLKDTGLFSLEEIREAILS